MGSRLTFRAGFDWSRVRFDGPDDPVSNRCSYCGYQSADDSAQLRLMGATRFAVFCDACVKCWVVAVPGDR